MNIGDVRIQPSDEARHFLVIGQATTGRSMAIAQMIMAARSRGDSIIVSDRGGIYYKTLGGSGHGKVMLPPRQNEHGEIHEWLAYAGDQAKQGIGHVLYMPYQTGELQTRMTRAINAALVESTHRSQEHSRLMIVVDALDTLDRMERLSDALPYRPNAGASIVLAAQSIDQVRQIYGSEDAARILHSPGNIIALRNDRAVDDVATLMAGRPDPQLTLQLEKLLASKALLKTASESHVRSVRLQSSPEILDKVATLGRDRLVRGYFVRKHARRTADAAASSNARASSKNDDHGL